MKAVAVVKEDQESVDHDDGQMAHVSSSDVDDDDAHDGNGAEVAPAIGNQDLPPLDLPKIPKSIKLLG